MTKAISQDLAASLYERWTTIGELQIRSDVAKQLKISAPNLDKMVGLPNSGSSKGAIGGLLPSPQIRISAAARDFSKAMNRYASLTKIADQLAKGAKTKKPPEVAHLRQAALVLGVGSFDAYVKSYTIERYFDLIFTTSTSIDNVNRAWTSAIKEAVNAQPDLLTEAARLQPPKAKRLLAEKVFEMHQVRLVTSNFATALAVLRTTDLNIEVNRSEPTSDPTRQFLQLARPIFDAYAQARHWIVHTGTASRGSAVPYCASQVPQRFLGDFLGGIVTVIERGGITTP